MPDGIVIRNPATNAVIFDATTVNSHARGVITTSGAAGSQNVSSLLRGTPFIIQALPSDATPKYNVPDFQINGSTVSWNSAARHMRVLLGSFAGAAPTSTPVTSTGIVIRNPVSRAIQISSSDPALQLSHYDSVTLTPDLTPSPLPMVRASITVTGTNPVVAFRAQDGKSAGIHRIVSNGGGSYTFHFQAQSAASIGLIYWVFDTSPSAMKLDTDAALATRDELNVKTFDSRSYVMKVAGLHEVTTPGTVKTMTAPAGKTYAAIQSSIGWHSRMTDLGAYGTGTLPPDHFEVGEPQDPRPPAAKWAFMQLLSHMTTASFNGSQVSTGLTTFEQWDQWQTVDIKPSYDTFGRARHTIIDVTGLPSAVMPNPNAPNVSLSATERVITLESLTATDTITPSVTATASGGSGGYSYHWKKINGDASVVANGSTSLASFSTKVVNQAPGTSQRAQWVVTVTDSSGASVTSLVVTFIHILGQIDVIPDAMIWPSQPWTTTNESISGAYKVVGPNISGINRNITLRFEVASLTSSFTSGSWSFTDIQGSTHTNLFGAKPLALNSSHDLEVSNGLNLTFKVSANSAGGTQSATGTMRVRNMSDGGTVIGTFDFSGTLDSDNSSDVTPDAVAVPAHTVVSNDATGETASTFHQIKGISNPITLKVEVVSPYGNLTTFQQRAFYNAPGAASSGGPWISAHTTTSSTFTVTNGQWLYFRAYGTTNAGRKSGTWTTRLINVTDGNKVIASWVNTVTVDDDDNMYDRTPDALDWDNISSNTNDASIFTANAAKAIGGINSSVVLRATISNVSRSANIVSSSRLDFQRNNAYVSDTGGIANGSYAEATFEAGQTARFVAHVATSVGVGNLSYTVTITNRSDGNKVLDTFTVTQTVDADDNHNHSYTPAAMDWANISSSQDDASYYVYNPANTVTGITKPVVLRATLSNVTLTGNLTSASKMDIQRNNAGVHDTSGLGNGYWTEATFEAGQTARFLARIATSSGRATASYTVTVTNRSDGNKVLDTFTVNQTVDADNNHNVTDAIPDAVATLTPLTPNTANNVAYGTDRDFRITGINVPITLRVSRAATINTGNLSKKYLTVSKSTDGANWTLLTTMTSDTQSYDLTVNNGDYIRLRIEIETSSGIARAAWNVTVTNQTGGGTVTTLAVDGTVDNDNNYNVTDVTPDAITVSNQTLTTNDASGNSSASFHQIKGITHPITLKVEILSPTGTLTGWNQIVYYNPTGAASSGGPWTSASTTTSSTFTVTNGQWVYFQCHGSSTGGRRSGTWTTRLINVTDGNKILASWTSTVTVDNDDNHNKIGISLSGTSIDHTEFSPAGTATNVSSPSGALTVVVTGGSGTKQLVWEKQSGSSSWFVSGTTSPIFSIDGTSPFTQSATYRLRVTDSSGTAYSNTITVRLGASNTLS